MRLPLVPLALATFFAQAAFAASPNASVNTPILVELFTSESCSSCPPADALLARLAQQHFSGGAQIIVLGEHVDYWDGLGWRDRFSSSQYTARQNEYSRRFGLDGVYTPQMVVDGSTQFVGNDEQLARQAIASAAKSPKLPLTLSIPTLIGSRFSASVALSRVPEATIQQGELYAALVDPVDTTQVQHGENGGRRLHHVSVVRTLARIGSTRDLARGPLSFTLAAPPGADPAAMQVVIFAQEAGAGPVLGAAMRAPATTHASF